MLPVSEDKKVDPVQQAKVAEVYSDVEVTCESEEERLAPVHLAIEQQLSESRSLPHQPTDDVRSSDLSSGPSELEIEADKAVERVNGMAGKVTKLTFSEEEDTIQLFSADKRPIANKHLFSPRTSRQLALDSLRSELEEKSQKHRIDMSAEIKKKARGTVLVLDGEDSKMSLRTFFNNHLVLAAAGVMATCMLGGATLFLSFSAFINSTAIEEAGSALSAFISLTEPDPPQVYSLLNVLVVINGTILVLALEVSAIVLQIAAARFSSQVVVFFFQSARPILLLAFFVFNMVYIVILAASSGPAAPMRSEAVIITTLTIISTLSLFPYFIDTFQITTAETIITKLGEMAYLATKQQSNKNFDSVKANTDRVSAAIERLANMALNAVQQSDKIYAYHVGNELCDCVLKYQRHKFKLLPDWFDVPVWHSDNPDFFSLDDEALRTMVQNQSWLEWKVLKQYQMIYDQAIRNRSYGVTSLIAVNTRKICDSASARGDGAVVDMCIKFFNTFLRYAISADDGRSCGNVLHQYRQVAEFLLYNKGKMAWKSSANEAGPKEERAVMVAKYLAYYAEMALKRDLGPITELCAHDLSTLCQLAYLLESPLHERLLSTFLCVDDVASALQIETAVMGIRKAQLKLATTYMENGDEDLARQIQADMAEDPPDRMAIVRRQLTEFNEKEFWEVGERGTNVDYLKPTQQDELQTFFSWFGEDYFTALEEHMGSRVSTSTPNTLEKGRIGKEEQLMNVAEEESRRNSVVYGPRSESQGSQQLVADNSQEFVDEWMDEFQVNNGNMPSFHRQSIVGGRETKVMRSYSGPQVMPNERMYNRDYIQNRGTSIILPSSSRPVTSDQANGHPGNRKSMFKTSNGKRNRASQFQASGEPVMFL